MDQRPENSIYSTDQIPEKSIYSTEQRPEKSIYTIEQSGQKTHLREKVSSWGCLWLFPMLGNGLACQELLPIRKGEKENIVFAF